jgi:hypothetical protein
MRPILAVAALALTLAACGKSERSAVSLEVNGDPAGGSATITCKESTTGTCHVLFKTVATTKRASAAAGTSTTVAGLPIGTSFCGGYTPPELDSCKPIVLLSGHQVIRHERTVRN